MSAHYSLVVGLGKTGWSIASFLKAHKKPFIVFDTRVEPPDLLRFKEHFPDVDVYTEVLSDAVFPSLDEVIASPGVSLDKEPFLQLKKQGISIIGDIECFARNNHAPVIAITGTNGKSTVTTLIGYMAKEDKKQVVIAGNIGSPVLDVMAEHSKADLWVLELSSFQLELIHSLSPIASTILNVTPDHLDRHHSMDNYIRAKQRIYRQSACAVFNREDMITKPNKYEGMLTSFGLDNPKEGEWGILYIDGLPHLAYGQTPWLACQDMILKGTHNWQNALAAAALAHASGISKTAICHVLKTFSGLPHRCQWVKTINGVEYINDSKGTNIGATEAALRGIGDAISGKIILIVGGQAKEQDFSGFSPIVSRYVRSLILIGEDAIQIESALDSTIHPHHATSLEQALSFAKEQALEGDVVLLSPACASFDMFRDFNHRGDVFTTLVNAL